MQSAYESSIVHVFAIAAPQLHTPMCVCVFSDEWQKNGSSIAMCLLQNWMIKENRAMTINALSIVANEIAPVTISTYFNLIEKAFD